MVHFIKTWVVPIVIALALGYFLMRAYAYVTPYVL